MREKDKSIHEIKVTGSKKKRKWKFQKKIDVRIYEGDHSLTDTSRKQNKFIEL